LPAFNFIDFLMFQGLRTIVYPVADLNRAKRWYSQVLGQEPYFRRSVLCRLQRRRV
jgi:extradiol dioxygenase family protein